MNKYLKILVAALSATAVMTGFMLLAPFVGLPKMNVGVIIGSVFNSEIIGWVIHILIGILFVIPYVFFFNRWLPVDNQFLRGTIYGIIVFFFSEIILTIANFTGHLSSVDKENMALMVFGNALAGMIYGTVLGAFFVRDGKDGLELAK
jgi:hypothetical protein